MTRSPDGSSRDAPILRPSARLLILDPNNRLLLFRIEGQTTEPILWITPGGGLEPGESYEKAAVRELAEETGLDAPIGPCVWKRRHTFIFNGRWYDSRERFFVVRSPVARIADAGWTDEERTAITAHRWWSHAELVAWDPVTGGVFVPRRLAELLPPILAGAYPAEPIDTGV